MNKDKIMSEIFFLLNEYDKDYLYAILNLPNEQILFLKITSVTELLKRLKKKHPKGTPQYRHIQSLRFKITRAKNLNNKQIHTLLTTHATSNQTEATTNA